MLLARSTSQTWRLINYRTVDDLVSAEFLHDLYNRHRPEVNSIRFRNTRCVYRGTEFTSYAPIEEWGRLESTLGYQFFQHHPRLFAQIRNYMLYKKPHLWEILNRMEGNDVPTDAMELAQQFVDLHYTALGEIYGINLVQLEHAICWAIKQHLIHTLGRSDWESLLPYLIKANESTVAVLEEMEILRYSIGVSTGELSLEQANDRYSKEFGHVHFAYGSLDEQRPTQEKIKQQLSIPLHERMQRLELLKKDSTLSKEIELLKADEKIGPLCELAADIGVLRDQNKALMGKVSLARNKLLVQIAQLTNVSRRDLSRYLLAELYDLLVDGVQLSEETLKERWELVVFQRLERMWEKEEALELASSITSGTSERDQEGVLGLSASPGRVQGTVKHVRSTADAMEVTGDHILVAMGTDFNLMEGLLNCAGVVTEEGGLLSHASVISRELEKPCIIGVKNVFSRLPEGTRIDLDADQGILYILEQQGLGELKLEMLSLEAATDLQKYGYKAVRIQQLLALGMPVVPGVVLSTGQDIQQFGRVHARQILRFLSELGIQAEKLIVRSSSPLEDMNAKSMAGIFESTVTMVTELSLLHGLQKVYAAANSSRTVKFLQATDQIPIALLIQPYKVQEWGGVAFSRHPVTGVQEVLVEASSKGAMAVVRGNPEHRVSISHSKLSSDYHSGSGLSHLEDIFNYVAQIAWELEIKLQYPVDIEWGVSNGAFYLFQVRPITTIERYSQIQDLGVMS